MASATISKVSKVPKIKDQSLFIAGDWGEFRRIPLPYRARTSGKTFPTINPAVAELARVPVDAESEVRRLPLLSSGPWPKMDAADRGRLLFRLADLVEQHARDLAALESLNCGKTLNDSLGDMQGVVNTLRYYGGWADKIEGRTVPVRGNFLSYTLRQPVGVVGQIIPWNFPLLMLAWKWGPAVAELARVPIDTESEVWRLPLLSPALRVAELAQEAGFPDGVINVINGFGETTGAALVAHPKEALKGKGFPEVSVKTAPPN